MVLCAHSSLAQSWSQVTPSPPTPSARNRGAMAFDAARGLSMLFGGYNGTATPLGDFWAFNGSSWQQLGGTVPAARWGHSMVYDTRRERLVLFGGFQPSPGSPLPDAIGLDDTWEYDGFGWTQRPTTTQPSPRGYFGMTYDPIRQRTVLFGGAGPNTTYLQDTWEWNGTTWTAVNLPVRPSIRRGPAMAFDMERAEVVLFGGGAFGTQFGDTWVYNGTTWTQRTPATSPPARWESTMAFDPLCGQALLQGGTTFDYQTIFGDSWLWSGVTWTQVVGTQPSARHGVAAAFDLQAGRSLWLGGHDGGGFRSDLWAREGGCNRTMSTLAAAVAGQVAQYRYNYPSTATNHLYFELWTRRNSSAFVLPISGFVPAGLTRVDVLSILWQGAGVLATGGRQDTAPFAIPNLPAVVGFTFDVQDMDIDLASNFLHWAGNDIEATVAPGGVSLGPTLNMVAIPPGTFQMGSNASTGSPYFSSPVERPLHAVTITQPFWMGRHEVTQAQYQAVMGSNPSWFQGASWLNAANRPVERVTWFNAVAYCDALTVQEAAAGRLPAGYEYRLPTEAEWEYCCRAGTSTEYHYGASLVCGQASFHYSHHTGSVCPSPHGAWTAVVGSYPANAWGLHDLHGNVWEWCLDSWDGSANYPAGPVSNPYLIGGFSRVIRGGSWNFDSGSCRSAERYLDIPTQASFSLGFRVVCAPILP
jgi:formylglycine-generating enzyme required for sulfatase activity